MAKYKYTAKGADGKTTKGVLEALDDQDLYNKLRIEGKYLISSAMQEERKSSRRLKAKQLSEFTRQLGTLLKAGVSLVRALSIISMEESIQPWERKIYDNVLHLIRQGISLSDSMEAQEGAFPDLLINMFRSAEMAGNMDRTALRMAAHYEKDYRLNGKVKNAMMYPIILLVMTVVVVIFIFTFVMPQFQSLFDMMDELPGITRAVMWLTELFKTQWVWLIVGAVFLFLVISAIFRIPAVRLWKDKIKLRLPIVGKLLKTIYTARFTRTLSSLYSSGLPIVSALQIGRDTIGNLYIAAQFDEAIAKVRGGATLSSALAEIDGFVNKLPSSVMIGEETGSLDTMLDSISDTLDYESEMAISRLVTLLEPVMLIIMAIIIAIVMMSVLIPVFNSYGAVEQQGNVY